MEKSCLSLSSLANVDRVFFLREALFVRGNAQGETYTFPPVVPLGGRSPCRYGYGSGFHISRTYTRVKYS